MGAKAGAVEVGMGTVRLGAGPVWSGPRWQGGRLLGWISLGLLLMAVACLAASPDVEGVRRLIRLTARTSLGLFLLAFTASAVAQRWPGEATRWQLRNRRHLGLGFAVSHGVHLAAIVAYAQLDPAGFRAATTLGNFVSGGLAYAVIVLMSASSNAAAVAWLGAVRWRRLHTAGVYYLWVSFMITFGKRLPMSPWYALPLVLLLMALALRWWPRRGVA